MKPFIIEVCVFHFALKSVLSQTEDNMHLHPITFHSWKLELLEINYKIHNDLLAILDSFEHWRHLLGGFPHHIFVYNDHKNLSMYFQNARVLRQW